MPRRVEVGRIRIGGTYSYRPAYMLGGVLSEVDFGTFIVLGEVQHALTHQRLVLYQHATGSRRLWVCPEADFATKFRPVEVEPESPPPPAEPAEKVAGAASDSVHG